MSKWEKSSAGLVDLFSRIVPAGPDVQHRQMFGYPAAFVNGNLFAGLFKQHLMIRLAAHDEAAFLQRPNSAPFSPMPGRPIKGYVMFSDPLTENEDDLRDWLRRALDSIAKLPAKTARAVSSAKPARLAKSARAAKSTRVPKKK